MTSEFTRVARRLNFVKTLSWNGFAPACGLLALGGTLLFPGGTAQAAGDACRLSRTSSAGQELVVMENAHVALSLAPAQGGAAVQLLYKPTGAKWTGPGGDVRLLNDRVWNPRDGSDDWSHAPYRLTVLKETPEELEVELAGQGKTGLLQFTTFHKRITLRRDSAAIRIRYAFEVGHDAMSPQTVGLWFSSALWLSGRKMTGYLPAAGAVQTLAYDPAMPGPDQWDYEPARGWRGCIGSDGSGLAARMDYKNLMCFYTWRDREQMSMDWMLRNVTIPNGSSFETEVVLLPFHGLSALNGAGAGGVAGLTVPVTNRPDLAVPLQASVFLAAPVTEGAAVWSWRKLPEKTWHEAGRQPVTVTRPGTTNLAFSWPPGQEGVYGVRLEIFERDRSLVQAESSCAVGAAPGRYTMLPEAERIGDPQDHFGRAPANLKAVEIPWRRDVVTPHVEWAKPYAKGKVKALILVHWQNSREAVELAQRMDLDFDCPIVNYGDTFFIGDAYGKQNPEVTSAVIGTYLKKKGYDVIVVAGVNWAGLADRTLPALLRRQVSQGAGLVYIGPRQLPPAEDWSMLGIDLSKPQSGYNAAWQPLENGAIVSGVPTEALPATGILGYAPTDGNVFLRAKYAGKLLPLGVAREHNGQRTVVLNYSVSRIFSGYGDTLTPYLRSPAERFHYWEYHHSLLAKAILWAARREPGVTLDLQADPPQPAIGTRSITVTASVGGAPPPAGGQTVEFVLRDKYSNELARQTHPAGKSPARFVIRQPLPEGLYFVDAILRSRAGVLNWGSTTFRVTGPTALAGLALPGRPAVGDSHHYVSGDLVAPIAVVTNARPGQTLRAEFTDSLGRVLARQTVPVPAGDRVEVRLPFTVDRPVATVGNIHVDLQEGGRTLDRADIDFVTYPDRYVQKTWDDFEWIPMGSVGPYTQGYLVPTAARLYHDAGLTMLFGSTGWDSTEDLRNEHEATIRSGFRVLEFALWNSYPKGYAEDLKAYSETHDKKFLERKPSLSDPAYRQAMVDQVKSKVRKFKIFHPTVWGWGDEQSVIGRIPVFDYDFSPVALQEFRQWLQREYSSLAALNAEWKTSFPDWDHVTPHTTAEAQADGHFASWSDHRAFMEYSYAGFFDLLQRAAQEECPGAVTGLSGTQPPTAYNGCDWTRFSTIFGFVQPYYGSFGQPEIHPMLNPAAIRAPWCTGYGAASQRGENVWEALLRGDNGVSYFSPTCFLNPDYTYTRSALSDLPAVRAIQQTGLGKLLMGGDKLAYDPVAVLHSQRAIHGATALHREWWHSHKGWFQALYALGLAPRLISCTQLDHGELTPDKFKVCVLPMSCAISSSEAAMLRRYVEAGGVLVTDHHTGIFDGHCGAALPGLLDELFGLEHTAFNRPGPSAADLRFAKDAESGLDLSALSWNAALPEGGIVVRGGCALGQSGGVPCVITHRVGAGRTCYLNLEMGRHTTGRIIALNDFHRALTAALMAWAGVEPAVRAEPMLAEGRIYAHAQQNARYIGYVRPRTEPEVRTLVIPEPRHVYDCQDGAWFGFTNRFAAAPAPRAADIFALLPYRVKALKLAPAAAARPGTRCPVALSLEVEGGPPARHVVHVTVLRPDGAEAPWYSANVALSDGRGTFELPFALNDPPGAWRLKARDAATGVTAETKLRLRP